MSYLCENHISNIQEEPLKYSEEFNSSKKNIAVKDCLEIINNSLKHETDVDKIPGVLVRLKSEFDKDFDSKIYAAYNGAYDVILNVLTRFGEHSRVVYSALKNMIRVTGCRSNLLNAKGIEYQISSLKTEKNLSNVQLLLRWMKHCCIKSEQNRQDIFDAKIMDVLKNILQNKFIRGSKLMDICSLLRALTLDDDPKFDYGYSVNRTRDIGNEILVELTIFLESNFRNMYRAERNYWSRPHQMILQLEIGEDLSKLAAAKLTLTQKFKVHLRSLVPQRLLFLSTSRIFQVNKQILPQVSTTDRFCGGILLGRSTDLELENHLVKWRPIISFHPRDKIVLNEILKTLITLLSVENEYCKKVENAGGLNLVLDTMRSFPDDENLNCLTLRLIKVLTRNDDVKMNLATLGAAPLIIMAMSKIQTGAMAVAGLRCMAGLTFGSPRNSRIFYDWEAPRLIIETMKRYRGSLDVQSYGARTISNMGMKNKIDSEVFLKFDVEIYLEIAMKIHGDKIEDDIKDAFANLGLNPELKDHWSKIPVKKLRALGSQK